jgi:hypothetical protein
LFHHAADNLLGRGCAGRDPNRLLALQPVSIDLVCLVDQVGRHALVLCQLAQTIGVGTVGRTYHQQDVTLPGQIFYRVLAVLGGIADIVLARPLDRRETLSQCRNNTHRVVHRQRGLSDKGQVVRVFNL